MADEKKKCAGHRTSGYWKGYPCGAMPKHKKNGKWWCKNHLPLDKEQDSGGRNR